MNNREIYEVGRADYAAFVEGIKPSARDIRVEEEGATVFTNIYSASRNNYFAAEPVIQIFQKNITSMLPQPQKNLNRKFPKLV